ncbi:hypothetical protein HKX48_000331 [Thoreauomyces humboldtii]|nr:hypothetical protein HKX48_000331 [Thoreauomyces humboldtii]
MPLRVVYWIFEEGYGTAKKYQVLEMPSEEVTVGSFQNRLAMFCRVLPPQLTVLRPSQRNPIASAADYSVFGESLDFPSSGPSYLAPEPERSVAPAKPLQGAGSFEPPSIPADPVELESGDRLPDSSIASPLIVRIERQASYDHPVTSKEKQLEVRLPRRQEETELFSNLRSRSNRERDQWLDSGLDEDGIDHTAFVQFARRFAVQLRPHDSINPWEEGVIMGCFEILIVVPTASEDWKVGKFIDVRDPDNNLLTGVVKFSEPLHITPAMMSAVVYITDPDVELEHPPEGCEYSLSQECIVVGRKEYAPIETYGSRDPNFNEFGSSVDVPASLAAGAGVYHEHSHLLGVTFQDGDGNTRVTSISPTLSRYRTISPVFQSGEAYYDL